MEQNTSLGSVAAEAKPRVRGRERWRALVGEQRASGLGVAAFCRQRSIATSSFYGWRQKLLGPPRRAKAGVGGTGPDRDAAFVPVRLAGSVSSGTVQGGRGEVSLEVRLRGGRRLVVRRGFERGLLVELIGVLEGVA